MENKVCDFDLDQNQPLKYFSKIISDSSLSFQQKGLYQQILTSYQKTLLYRERRNKNVNKYKVLAFSFVSGQHYRKDLKPLLNETKDHNYDFATFFSIIKSNLADSELEISLSDLDQDNFDIQECLLNYEKDHGKPSKRITLIVDLYRIILQILGDDYQEAQRLKESLLDIVPTIEDHQDSSIFCLNSYSELRLLYQNKILNETLYRVAASLVQHYMIYSRNNNGISFRDQEQKINSVK